MATVSITPMSPRSSDGGGARAPSLLSLPDALVRPPRVRRAKTLILPRHSQTGVTRSARARVSGNTTPVLKAVSSQQHWNVVRQRFGSLRRSRHRAGTLAPNCTESKKQGGRSNSPGPSSSRARSRARTRLREAPEERCLRAKSLGPPCGEFLFCVSFLASSHIIICHCSETGCSQILLRVTC